MGVDETTNTTNTSSATKNHNHIPFTEVEERLAHSIVNKRETAAQRFPLFFGLAATFGLVSVLYGFEKLIDQTTFLANNPAILLVIGLVVLMATGAAYRKLS